MGWVKFAICFFAGVLGVHKFMEGKTGMGILYLFTGGLCGIGWIYDCIIYFRNAMSDTGSTNTALLGLSDSDPLPVVNATNTMLSAGEICHHQSPASFFTSKNVVVGYTGGSRGVSIRVCKGMSYRVGASKSQPIRRDVQEKFPGILTITNKRIIFSGTKGAFDKKISALSSITPYNNGIAFQFGEKTYPLLCENCTYICQIISRIVNTTDTE